MVLHIAVALKALLVAVGVLGAAALLENTKPQVCPAGEVSSPCPSGYVADPSNPGCCKKSITGGTTKWVQMKIGQNAKYSLDGHYTFSQLLSKIDYIHGKIGNFNIMGAYRNQCPRPGVYPSTNVDGSVPGTRLLGSTGYTIKDAMDLVRQHCGGGLGMILDFDPLGGVSNDCWCGNSIPCPDYVMHCLTLQQWLSENCADLLSCMNPSTDYVFFEAYDPGAFDFVVNNNWPAGSKFICNNSPKVGGTWQNKINFVTGLYSSLRTMGYQNFCYKKVSTGSNDKTLNTSGNWNGFSNGNSQLVLVGLDNGSIANGAVVPNTSLANAIHNTEPNHPRVLTGFEVQPQSIWSPYRSMAEAFAHLSQRVASLNSLFQTLGSGFVPPVLAVMDPNSVVYDAFVDGTIDLICTNLNTYG